MHILLACAKTMNPQATTPSATKLSTPQFQKKTDLMAKDMAQYNIGQLEDILHIKHKIASQVYDYYRNFPIPETRKPAATIYDGLVFKNLQFEKLTQDQMTYANSHISICSFLYGILRPLDLINPYRLEAKTILPSTDPLTVIASWRQLLTDHLITTVKNNSKSILLNLASEEMKGFFDWNKIEEQLNVITPRFAQIKSGKRHISSTYSKIARGAMARMVITNRITDPEQIYKFDKCGFQIAETDQKSPLFVINQ